MSTEKLAQEIQTLDAEARTALDKLADRREELQRQLKATELAEKRQREREAERRRQEAEEAERKALEEAKARADALHEELASLDARRDELAEEINGMLEKYGEVYGELMQEYNGFAQTRANSMASARGGMERRWLEDAFGRWYLR